MLFARARSLVKSPFTRVGHQVALTSSFLGLRSYAVFHSPHPTIDIPDDQSFSRLLLDRAALYGDKPAFQHAASERAVTFSELVRNAESLASNLIQNGLGRGERVCIHMPNIPEYPEIFHGTGVAGGVSTTSSPLFTAEELATQLADSDSKFIVTARSLLSVVLEATAMVGMSNGQVVVVEDNESDLSVGPLPPGVIPYHEMTRARAGELPRFQVDGRSEIATLPYSSGTTGKPKGVMLTHKNLIANMLQLTCTEQLRQEHHLVAVLPFYHIYPLMLLMSNTIYAGSTTSVMPRFDLELFLRTLERNRVQRAHIAPPLAVALAKHPLVDQFDLSALRMLFSGAAPLSKELEAQVCARLGVQVKQAYGMTELSPACNCGVDHDLVSGSVGPLLPNTSAKVVDPDGNELGVGEVGEILISGPQVMLGYLGRDDATKEIIGEDGFLHTGDTGFVDEKNHFWIVDRVKELVKYKGHQVPPAELEALLLNHPAVADAAVIGVRDEAVGELPKAFVVLKEGAEATTDQIMQEVNHHLAQYKHIRLCEQVDQIPKSPAGKILRRLLRDAENAK